MQPTPFEYILFHGIEFIVIIVLFFVMTRVVKYAVPKIKQSKFFSSSRFLNPTEYFPDEEIFEIKQLFYLIMITLFVINILYILFSWKNGHKVFGVLDIVLSLYLAYQMEKKSYTNKLLLFSVIPFTSISFLIFGVSWYLFIFELIHAMAFVYFIKVYYQMFYEYTETNSLGITIMLLFLIIFISFLVTIPVENVSPLDSIEMVSNAFTSNGYAVLGKSSLGKLNAVILVWSGFILSGVGTATLAVSIVMRYVNGKFDRLEELAKKNKKD